MGVEMFILFKRFFSYLGFSVYSVYYSVLVYNLRILQYSVYSTIPFPHSVIAPVTPQHEQCVMETVESKVKLSQRFPPVLQVYPRLCSRLIKDIW